MASFLDILAPNRLAVYGPARALADVATTGRARVPDLESCVRFDLQQLLNTRRPATAFTAEYPELATSVLNFGLQDFAFAEIVSDEDRDRLAQHIADVIAAFEPRLTDVRVIPRDRDGRDGRDRQTVIYFHISARLIGPGGAVEADFSNLFEWTTGHHEVTQS